MSLKLFRSTGFSSILSPGEAKVALHPGWMIVAISAWAGFACNVALWRLLPTLGDGIALARALCLGLFIAAACAFFLSVLGWRTTLKPAGTLLVFLAALAACSIWGQGLPVDASLMERRLSSLIFPPWTTLLRWQVSVLLVGLALVPTVLIWQTKVKRLPGPQQLSANMAGCIAAVVVLAASGYVLFRVLA